MSTKGFGARIGLTALLVMCAVACTSTGSSGSTASTNSACPTRPGPSDLASVAALRSMSTFVAKLGARPTGIQRYTVELANALHAAGRPATLVTGADEGEDAGVADLQVLAGSARRRHLSWSALRRPLFEHVAGGYGVVHMSSPAFAVPTRLPLVVTIHDLIPITSPDAYEPGPRWAFRQGVKYAVDHAARFIVPSEFTRREVLDTLDVAADRIAVVPEGVPAVLSRTAGSGAVAAALPTDRPYFVAIGGLIPRKNLDVAIQAIAQLGPAGPRLFVIGDGPERSRLQARIDGLPDPQSVRLLGHLADQDLAAVLRGASGLLHPALSEGFGLTTIEAMAAGVPVVAAATGSLPEVVGDAGVLLPPTDVDQWAAAITRLTQDPSWREALRAQGVARAATFTWTKAAEATAAIYAAIAR